MPTKQPIVTYVNVGKKSTANTRMVEDNADTLPPVIGSLYLFNWVVANLGPRIKITIESANGA